MELWVPITVAAAFMQTVRSALQKRLQTTLGTNGSTYCRFVYALPFALIYPILLAYGTDSALPTPNTRFALFAVLGGISQIVATALLIYLFSLRNFAAGVAYSKTETVQTAIFSLVILGDVISVAGGVAIAVSLIGVILVSLARDAMSSLLSSGRAAVTGLVSGGLFGFSAVAYRAASLALDNGGFLIRAAFTLAFAVLLQTVVMTVWIRFRQPGQLTRVFQHWRIAWLVGLSGMLGSAGWFTAMTLENAAHVRAVGQIELVFAFIASYFFFHERPDRAETTGITLIMLGVIVLVIT